MDRFGAAGMSSDRSCIARDLDRRDDIGRFTATFPPTGERSGVRSLDQKAINL
jgi:hypothetical protein